MYPITRINFDAKPASESFEASSLSKYNLRPRGASRSGNTASAPAPVISSRRRQRSTLPFPEKTEGATRPAKRIRLDARNAGPVLQAGMETVKPQQLAPVAKQDAPIKLIETGELPPLRNYLMNNPGQSEAKAGLLQQAAHAGWLDAFDLLLEFGALADYHRQHPESEAGHNPTLFHAAVHGGNIALLNRLNEADCQIHQRSRDELKQGIIWSLLKGGQNMTEILCDAAALSAIRWEPSELSAFLNAAILSPQCRKINCVWDIPAISYLIGRYPGSCDATVFSRPAFSAVRLNHWEAVSALLSVYGAAPDSVDPNGASLLSLAANAGHPDIYELLRFHDASPHAIDHDGNSVLHHAVAGGNDAIAYDLIFNCGADLNVKNNAMASASSLAASLSRDSIHAMIMTAAERESADA